MNDTERKKWAYGSQIFLVGLINYFLIVWILKFNMLCFYSRVVRHLWTEKFVKPLMVIVILSGIAILFTITLNCRPFRHYWQVWPDPGRKTIHICSKLASQSIADNRDRPMRPSECHRLYRHAELQYFHRHLHHAHPHSSMPSSPTSKRFRLEFAKSTFSRSLLGLKLRYGRKWGSSSSLH